MLEAIVAKALQEQRIREAEKANRFAHIQRPSRLSVAFKSLTALLARL